MNFLFPQILWLLLLPVIVALYCIFRKRPLARTALALPIPMAAAFRKRLRWTRWIFRLFFLGTLVAVILLIVASARPFQLKKWTEKWAEGIDIVLALDVSESMDATDFAPNRITVAKQVLRDFIQRRQNDRIGLVLFGGEAITKAPLTRDYAFLLSQLENVQLRELKQGTAIGMALASSVGRLRGSESRTKVIILLTDGDSNVGSINPITATHLAKDERIKIYSIGIGKKNRVVVPIYAYDRFGKRSHLITKVPSYLNPDLLKNISKLTGGKAYMAYNSDSLDKVLREIDQLEKTRTQVTPRQKRVDLSFPFAGSAVALLLLLWILNETRFRRHAVSI